MKSTGRFYNLCDTVYVTKEAANVVVMSMDGSCQTFNPGFSLLI